MVRWRRRVVAGGIRMFALIGAISLGLVLVLPGYPAAAQTVAQAETGAICVATFTDTNANGVQDSGETLLAGVNVNLATGGAIIATHITSEDELRYCFENLLRGDYTVIFTDAPTYTITTPNEGSFTLDAGERLTVDPFGAQPVPLDVLRAELIAQDDRQSGDEPLDPSTRLLLATVGSMMVMLFMVGLGAVLMGLMNRRRPRIKPPREIVPPGNGFPPR